MALSLCRRSEFNADTLVDLHHHRYRFTKAFLDPEKHPTWRGHHVTGNTAVVPGTISSRIPRVSRQSD